MKRFGHVFGIIITVICIIIILKNPIITFTNKYLVNSLFSSIEQKPIIDVCVLLLILVLSIYYLSKYLGELVICSFRIGIITFSIVLYLLCRYSDYWEFTRFSFNQHVYYLDSILIFGFYETFIVIKILFIKSKRINLRTELTNNIHIAINNFKYKRKSYCIYKLGHLKRLFIIKKRKNKGVDLAPFLYDNYTLNDDYKRKEYAQIICKRLITTYDESISINNIEQLPSFTVGISGEWGSGKTSFLNLMKTYLDKSSHICYIFSPWLCNSSNELISEFFKMLRQNLSPYNGNINKISSNYLRSLIQVDDHWLTKFLSFFIDDNKPSGDEYLKLNTEIKNINKPIFIFIDDLDRLNIDEIKEVFSLVRNTANFSNTFFILAYDREYVCNILKYSGIQNSERYLDKFINLDIELPSYELNIITDMLIRDLSKIISVNDKDYLQIIDFITSYSNPYQTYNGATGILNYFPTIRDVKRFINLFSSTFYSFKKFNTLAEVSIYDLYILEILKFKHRYVYNMLRFAPGTLLKIINKVYVIKGPILDEIKIIKNYDNKRDNQERNKTLYNLLKNINKDVNEEEIVKVSILLGELFMKRTNAANKNSLCFSVNYYRYFLFRLDTKSIPHLQFLSIVNGGENAASFRELINCGKKDSLYHNLVNLLPSDFVPITNVLNAIFEYVDIQESNSILFDGYEISGSWISINPDNLELSLFKLFNLNHIKNIGFSDKLDEYKPNIIKWIKKERFLAHKSILVKKLLENTSKSENDILKQDLFNYAEIEALASIIINKYLRYTNSNQNMKMLNGKIIKFLEQNKILMEIIDEQNHILAE